MYLFNIFIIIIIDFYIDFFYKDDLGSPELI